MSVFANAIAGFAGSLNQLAGEPVNLLRAGAQMLGPVSAVPDLVNYEVIDEQGMLTSVASYDWLFTATDLAGLPSPPRTGDRIAATVGDAQYEVMPIGQKPCAEPAEPDGILLVVHTKRVSQ